MKVAYYRDDVEPDFVWEPTPEEIRHDNEERFGDTADAYAIQLRPELPGGCIIFARFNGIWKPNPGGVRPLVRHLLELAMKS